MPDGRLADPSNPATWSTYEECVESPFPLCGYVFHKDDPYIMIDCDDHEHDPATPEQKKRHQKIIKYANGSYTEKSVGRWTDAEGRQRLGYHIIVRAKAKRNFRQDNIELFGGGKYFILTGDSLNGSKIKRNQKLVDTLCDEYALVEARELMGSQSATLSDEQLIERASGAENGAKFDKLCAGDWQGDYPSQSEADLALFNILGYYTRNDEQVVRIFHMTALGKRDKAHKPKYIMYNLRRMRAAQPPPIDLSVLLKNLEEIDDATTLEPSKTQLGRSGAGKTANNRTDLELRKREVRKHTVEETGQPENVSGRVSESRTRDRKTTQKKEKRIETVSPSGENKSQQLIQKHDAPGLLGDINNYTTESAIKPMYEAGKAGGLGFMACLCGAAFNCSGTGLNLYILLTAKTGMGKEGMAQGVTRLIRVCAEDMPALLQRIGPSHFASGQAILKFLPKQKCFLSILGEYGHKLKIMSAHNAHPSEVMKMAVTLDLYNKSGYMDTVNPAVYSDSDKDTDMVMSPAMSLLCEGTPESFFENMDESLLESGLIPRFTIIQHEGLRPENNENAFFMPPKQLIKSIHTLAEKCLLLEQQNKVSHILATDRALGLLKDFGRYCDAKINNPTDAKAAHMWNRAHLKALKTASLASVGNAVTAQGLKRPRIDHTTAQWATDEVSKEVSTTLRVFSSDEYATGNAKQEAEVMRVMGEYKRLNADKRRSFKVPKKLVAKRDLVPFEYLRRRTRGLSAFKDDRRGPIQALKALLQELVDSGIVNQLPHQATFDTYGVNAPVYFIGDLNE